jgi:hypothetical protein
MMGMPGIGVVLGMPIGMEVETDVEEVEDVLLVDVVLVVMVVFDG